MAEEKKPADDPGEVILKDVRLSFAHLFQPQEGKVDEVTGQKGEPKYNCSFLFGKSTPSGKANFAKVKAAAERVKKAKWGDNIPKLKPEKVCMRDGDLESYDGYADMFYVSSSNSRKPKLIDRDKSPLDEGSGKLYSGCYVNAVVRLWCQDNKHGKRVNASLDAVQFLRHGDAFGFREVDVDEKFEDVSDSDDAGNSDIGDDDEDLV
jgi:hypothetical protein